MSNISLDSVPVVNLLELFRSEMKKLDSLVEKLGTQTNNIRLSWRGNASEATLRGIDGFQKVFENIQKKNGKYVAFIDSVIVKYKALDEKETKLMESRRKAFDTSFYGDIQG